MVRTAFVYGTCLPRFDNSFSIHPDSRDLLPGFYDLRVSIELAAGKTLEGATTFGWHIYDEPLVRSEPSDFDSFWAMSQASLPDPSVGLSCEFVNCLIGDEISAYNLERAALPGRYDFEAELVNEVEVYKVDFASIDGSRVYGWFAKPVGNGPFPALLVLPGAGNNARPAPVEHARHGYAALDVQIHGFPVDLAEYIALPQPAYSSPANYLHYRPYLNAVQSSRALESLPSVDLHRIAVLGGSQGGRLSMVVAALNHNVVAAVAGITHYAYRPWLRWAEMCNAESASGMQGFQASDIIDDERTVVEQYFDVVNFAPRVQCPVLMNAGLIDQVSPPTGIYAAYRELTSPKEIVPLPNIAHDWLPSFDRYAWRWLSRQG